MGDIACSVLGQNVMSLTEEIQKEIANIVRTTWTERDGYVVPADESLKLGNDAVNVDATVL